MEWVPTPVRSDFFDPFLRILSIMCKYWYSSWSSDSNLFAHFSDLSPIADRADTFFTAAIVIFPANFTLPFMDGFWKQKCATDHYRLSPPSPCFVRRENFESWFFIIDVNGVSSSIVCLYMFCDCLSWLWYWWKTWCITHMYIKKLQKLTDAFMYGRVVRRNFSRGQGGGGDSSRTNTL